MRDRDPNRLLRIAKSHREEIEREEVITKEELEKRIDDINQEKEQGSHQRKQEEFDRQRSRDRDLE